MKELIKFFCNLDTQPIISGLPLPKNYEAGQYWSRNFVKELQATECGTEELKPI